MVLAVYTVELEFGVTELDWTTFLKITGIKFGTKLRTELIPTHARTHTSWTKQRKKTENNVHNRMKWSISILEAKQSTGNRPWNLNSYCYRIRAEISTGCTINSQTIFYWHYCGMLHYTTEVVCQFCHICSCPSRTGQAEGTFKSKTTNCRSESWWHTL